jgi:hypothetical protein
MNRVLVVPWSSAPTYRRFTVLDYGEVPRTAVAAVLVLTMFVAGCGVLRSRSPRAYVRVAEALTSATMNEAIRVAVPRLDPAVIDQGCRLAARRIFRLVSPSLNLQMQIGEQFMLSGLAIVAVDDAELVVSGVPLAIEAQDQSPAVLQLRTGDPDLARGSLRPVNTGEFLLRTYTLCGVPGAEAIFNVKVVPVPEPAPPPAFPGQVTGAGR